MRLTRKVPLARRMAFRDRGRFLITAGGVGFAVMLMMFLSGVLEGVKKGSTQYVADSPALIWACESNSSNLMRSSSFLEPEDGKDLAAFPGVKEVSGLVRVFTRAEIHGKPRTLLIFGVDPSSDLALPRRMIRGTRGLGPRELILDRAFAVKNGLKPGDSFEIQNLEFRVAGVSEGTNAVIIQFLFSRLGDAQELLELGDVVSFFLLKLDDGADAAGVLVVGVQRGVHRDCHDSRRGDHPRDPLVEVDEWAQGRDREGALREVVEVVGRQAGLVDQDHGMGCRAVDQSQGDRAVGGMVEAPLPFHDHPVAEALALLHEPLHGAVEEVADHPVDRDAPAVDHHPGLARGNEGHGVPGGAGGVPQLQGHRHLADPAVRADREDHPLPRAVATPDRGLEALRRAPEVDDMDPRDRGSG